MAGTGFFAIKLIAWAGAGRPSCQSCGGQIQGLNHMLDRRPGALRYAERLLADDAASSQGKATGPLDTALGRELLAYGQRHRVLVGFGKAAVHHCQQAAEDGPCVVARR